MRPPRADPPGRPRRRWRRRSSSARSTSSPTSRTVDALYGGTDAGFVYARDGHPNAARLAEKIARLEGGEAAVICASGMAAESAIFLAHLKAGDRVAISEGLYGRTTPWSPASWPGSASSTTCSTPPDPGSLAEVMRPATRMVFTETLSNPLLRLADIAGLAAITRPAGVLLAVDHTFAPLLCRPLALGADVVTHSVTKSIGGHSDVTLGALVGAARLDQADGARRLDLRPDRQPVRLLARAPGDGDAGGPDRPRLRQRARTGPPPRSATRRSSASTIPAWPATRITSWRPGR